MSVLSFGGDSQRLSIGRKAVIGAESSEVVGDALTEMLAHAQRDTAEPRYESPPEEPPVVNDEMASIAQALGLQQGEQDQPRDEQLSQPVDMASIAQALGLHQGEAHAVLRGHEPDDLVNSTAGHAVLHNHDHVVLLGLRHAGWRCQGHVRLASRLPQVS